MNTLFKTYKTRLAWFLTLVVLIFCQACENAQTALEQTNLEKAIYCMEILENRNDLEPSERIDILRTKCYREDFVEHSPHIADGRDSLLKLFKKRYIKYPELSMSIKRSASDGDLVWLHIHAKHTPDAIGHAGVQIFRMKDGKIAEHWGAGQAIPEKSKNNNTMF